MQQLLQVFVALICLGGSQAFAPRTSFVSSSRFGGVLSARTLQQQTRLFAEELEELDEADIEELETRKEGEVLARKLRSNMYNENGVAYAPWMVNQVDEEAYLAAKEMRKMRKQKEKKDMAVVNDAFLSTDLQADELSGQGLKYKFVRDEVELSWSTDMEVDTLGYKVQKRAARSDEWVTVASYEDWAPLNSQGENGGTYTLLDPDTELGDWIYRVIDVEASGRNTILCQVLVEVQNKGEVILQYVGAVGFALLLGGLATYAALLDPVQ